MYTDKEKLEITKLEYENYIRDKVVQLSNKKIIGYVSEVNH